MSRSGQTSHDGSSIYRVVLSQGNRPYQTVYVPAREQARADADIHENTATTTRQRARDIESTKQLEDNSELNKQLKEEIASLKAKMKVIEADQDGYRQKLEETDRREDELKLQLNQLKEQRDEYRRSKDTLLAAKNTLVTELSATKKRLSQMMGMKLSDENPDIADLSDQNRPTKLAERYTELYNNQWTDAFEVVAEEENERKGTDLLLDILCDIRDYCTRKADTQIDELKRAIMMKESKRKELSQGFMKYLKDYRKATAEAATETVLELYLEDTRKKYAPILPIHVLQPFVKECVELCWLMAVQTPPVVLGTSMKINTLEKFDTSIYKPYTVAGEYFDYLVWPPLYLHENGPLLAKGVAQGRKNVSEENTPKLALHIGSGSSVSDSEQEPSKPPQSMARSVRPAKSNTTGFPRTTMASSGRYDNVQYQF